MKFKSILKVLGMIVTSGALPEVLKIVGVTNPAIAGAAAAIPAVVGLFMRPPHKDAEHDAQKEAEKLGNFYDVS